MSSYSSFGQIGRLYGSTWYIDNKTPGNKFLQNAYRQDFRRDYMFRQLEANNNRIGYGGPIEFNPYENIPRVSDIYPYSFTGSNPDYKL